MPLVLIFGIMVALVVPTRSGPVVTGLGFPGIRLTAIGGGIMLVALAGISSAGVAAALLAGAAILLTAAVMIDRRSRERLMPTGAFWPDTVVGSGLWMVLLMPIAGATSAVYLVLLLQQLWGYGPTLAGVVGAVMAVAWSLSAVTVANARRRSTRKLLIRTGPVLVAAGLLGVLAGLEWTSLPLLIAAQIAIGAGFGISNGYLNLTLMESAPEGERDRTSALLPTTQSAGNAIGAALAGLAANSVGFAAATTREDMLVAIVPVFVLGATAAGLALLAALRTTVLVPREAGVQAGFAAE